MDFSNIVTLIHLSNMLYLFLPFLALKFMILYSFKIFDFLVFVLMCELGLDKI